MAISNGTKAAPHTSNGTAIDEAQAFIRPNVLKEVMARGDLALSFGIAMAHSTEVVHLAKLTGFSAVTLNLEHHWTGIETASEINRAALNLGITPVCIVPSCQSDWISRLLDNGAQAVIVPRTESAEMAKDLVRFSKHRPIGERPLAFTPQMQYQIPDFVQTQDAQNRTTISAPMIESVKGLENCENIASVKGIDMIFIGAHDLSDDMGIPGEFENPTLVAAIERICRAAAAASTPESPIYVGLGGYEGRLHLVSDLRRKYDNIRFVLAGRDVTALLAGMRGIVSTVAKLEGSLTSTA